MIPSIYINLEDDVSKIVARVKKERASEMVLVCPKRCFLFNDSINLRLLKKQADMLGKKLSILTMDERGKVFAQEAGFELKHFPKAGGTKGFSDIRTAKNKEVGAIAAKEKETSHGLAESALTGIKNLTKSISGKSEKPALVIESTTKEKIPTKEVEKDMALERAVMSHKTESLFPSELEGVYKKLKNKQKNSKLLGVFVALAVIVVLAVVFVILPKAEIIVYAKNQALTRDLIISVSTEAKQADSQSLVIPGTRITQPVSEQSSFQSQGKKEIGNKAFGSVVIYNFTGTTINLRAKTTKLLLNGKNYLLKSDALQIRPTKYKDAKSKEVDEASLTAPIEVEAELGGEGYNLPAGTRMELTNQVFGSEPQLLYVKVSSAITGGTSRYLSFISPDDITNAKSVLQNKAAESIAAQLKEKGLSLEQKAFQIQDPQFVFDKEAGTETPEFKGQISGQALGIAYSSEELEKIILERVQNSLSAQEKIKIKLKAPLVVNVKTVEFNSGLMVLEVHFEGVAVAELQDIENLGSKIKGKSQEQAAEYIKNNLPAEKTEITLSPGWQKSLPWLSGSIKINVK